MGEYLEGAMPNIKTHALSSYSADVVDIKAKLYLVNTNGSKVALPTSFDGVDAKYAEYRVRKPEPIAETSHCTYLGN